MFRRPLQGFPVASHLRYALALAVVLGACSDGTGPGGEVATVAITQSETVLAPLESAIFSAQARDASGLVLNQVPVTWTTSAAFIADVNAIGRVVAISAGTAEITATAGGISDTKIVTVAVNLRSPSVGSDLCGIDGMGTAFCGAFSDALAPVGHEGALQGISAGHGFACGIDGSGAGICWGSNGDGELGRGTQDAGGASQPPAPVSGGLVFDRIAAGSEHACGLTAGGLAYCWGDNTWGQLGSASTERALEPMAVLGGQQYRDIDADLGITCAIRIDGIAACWGMGHLGNATIHESHQPLAVSGGVPFTAITVGPDHACARTTTGVAFCWGSNADGQVGTGAAGGVVDVPTAIGGTLRLARIDAGGTHTCGLRGNGEAHCWGTGAIGIGTGTAAAAPTRVSTELRFASISAGEDRTCAATTGGATYCWGERFTAGGTPPDPLKPARIPLLGAP
jgi:hypothetical protein